MDSKPLRTTQLRAQFRIHTGFPIEPAGKIPGCGTILRCKDKKNPGLPGFERMLGEIAVVIPSVIRHFLP
jgi:hypothetical protein